jgi:hypothetical protein
MQAEKGETQPLTRKFSVSTTPSHMPDQSEKDEGLFSALDAGADKTEVVALLRDGADVNAKNEVLVSVNVFLLCGVMPNPWSN